SRRRHTRWPRDWSSDVCSSDLMFMSIDCERRRTAVARTPVMVKVLGALIRPGATVIVMAAGFRPGARKAASGPTVNVKCSVRYRSEERRVGKECRSGGRTDQEK